MEATKQEILFRMLLRALKQEILFRMLLRALVYRNVVIIISKIPKPEVNQKANVEATFGFSGSRVVARHLGHGQLLGAQRRLRADASH